MSRVLLLTLSLPLLGVFLWGLERWRPAQRLNILRRGFGTDLAYWFFTPLITRNLTGICVGIVAALGLSALGLRLDWNQMLHGFGPVHTLPIWLQVALLLVLGDLVVYWSHRWFHGRSLWKFHAVHHSSTELDWLSAVRVHPINDMINKTVQAVPFLLLGFSPLVLTAYFPLLTLHGLLQHANINWTFGPLRYVVASPVFHRWHHSRDPQAIDKNFAGLFPLWDVLFGTCYLPADRYPEDFGICGDPVPEELLGQLTYPFTTRPDA